MQNVSFSTYSVTMLVYSAIQAATTMLQLEKRSGDESATFFYSDFKKSFQRMANELERGVPGPNKARDLSITGRHSVNVLAERLIDFYKSFDSWHCGLNQLKTFKKLTFPLTCVPQIKVKQALELVAGPPTSLSSGQRSARLHTATSSNTPREKPVVV